MIPDKLRSLYPTLTEEELLVAKENLDQYLLLAWEIFQEREGNDSTLTLRTNDPSMNAKVDSPKNNASQS